MSSTTEFQLIDAPTAPQDLLPSTEKAPLLPLKNLDVLWIQITGTLCNIQCSHCFISCGPNNHDLEVMSREQIKSYLDEAEELGVKEFYFTGGEPFIHKDIVEIFEDTLKLGPVTVLTNAMLIREKTIQRLREVVDQSNYDLNFRVSLDGFDTESHDAIRGPGSFTKAMEGLKRISEFGFTPIITATRTWECCQEQEVINGFKTLLTNANIREVNLKILPNLHIGREAIRSRGYTDCERITEAMMKDYDASQLICSNARIATADGVKVCPILVGAKDATMGKTLKDSLGPYPLRHRACYTCYSNGAICSNESGTVKIGENCSEKESQDPSSGCCGE